MAIVKIPSWMDELAPGAAQAIRQISADKNLTDAQRHRLERLASGRTKPAWRELRRSHQSKKKLSSDEQWRAQHEILWETYRAADFPPIGGSEITRANAHLKEIASTAMELSRDISSVGKDVQLCGLWGTYRNSRRADHLLMTLPGDLVEVGEALKHVGVFFERAVLKYKPQGPVPPTGQPRGANALKTTVIRKIAEQCKSHFGAVLYSTVATLANASLDRTDIDRQSVRGSLRQ